MAEAPELSGLSLTRLTVDELFTVAPSQLLQTLSYLRPPPRRTFDEHQFAALRDHVFREARREIRHRYRPGSAPPCYRASMLEEMGHPHVDLEFRIYDGSRHAVRCELRYADTVRHLDHVGFPRICRLYWDAQAEAFNDHRFDFDWRNDAELRNRVEDASRGLAPRPTTDEGFRVLGLDRGAIGPQADFFPAHVEGDWAEDFHARIAATQAATARGEKLLREWLSPEQLAQYDKEGQFEVVGCHTGQRYRLFKAASYNVLELDRYGRARAALCFLPEGQLVPGDTMLAQKLALETNERAALAVANRDSRGEPFGFRLVHAALGRIVNLTA